MDASEQLTTNLHIDRLSSKGKGIGTFQKSPTSSFAKIEVAGTVPGDEVTAALGRKRRGSYDGFLREVTKRSPLRVEPRCVHVPLCGGCSIQQMDYGAQLKEKQKIIEAAFKPIFQEGVTTIYPILPCSNPWEYRNKMEFSFSQDRMKTKYLGLIQNGGKGRVFNLKECHLVSPWFAKTLQGIRQWWDESGLEAYHLSKDEGSLRTLTLREGKRTGDRLAMLTVSGNPAFAMTRSQLDAFVEVLKKDLKSEEVERLSIFLRIQQVAKGSPTQFYEMQLSGPDHLKEKLEIAIGDKKTTLTFKISPTSFFQPNTFQAECLYSHAINLLNISKESIVFDLYCGTATLSMALALKAKKVIGIELNPHSVFDAEDNKKLNNLPNVEIYCGDVGKVLGDLKAQNSQPAPDIVLVDPPRTGLEKAAIEQIISLNPKEILYISCHPQKQALDIPFLQQAGYQLVAVQPVDQFPHTMHIENIALLQRGS